jgi:hypothetical protein
VGAGKISDQLEEVALCPRFSDRYLGEEDDAFLPTPSGGCDAIFGPAARPGAVDREHHARGRR